jgi:dienelactone hydrolase
MKIHTIKTFMLNTISKMGWKKIILLGMIKLAMTILLFSCTKNNTTPSSNNTDTTTGNPVETTESITLTNPTGGNMLKAVLFVPASNTAVPAVVVMHGSSGLWSNTDPTNTKLAAQFKGWIDSFRVHKIAVLFIDSYTPRGVQTFHNEAPPENLFLAAEFVRPRDAYVGLNYLRTLQKIIPNKIALLGYSHGGTTVLSTMVDAAAVAKATQWSVMSNNIVYTDNVLPPAARPAAGGFVAAVSYYPGAAMFSYYGKPGTPGNGKYVPYAPIMIHAAALDPLYTTTYTNSDDNTQISAYDALILKAQLNPASATMIKYEYAGASHSFDSETTATADGAASKLARSRSIAFLKQYLF